MAAAKVGANDYRALVDQKLQTARELYEFMVNEFRESRAFLLELLVVIILIVELIPIFRGL
jgi:predicted house-cleaning noncanonical NTP pyrophosphatase (MazG superfamily)